MLYGSIINVISIIIGSVAGLFLTKLGEKYKETIMQGIGLIVILIGLQMALQTESFIIVLLSMLIGAILGEFLRLEELLEKLGHFIASKFKNKDRHVDVGQAFVTASLIFVVGAMAIIGAMDSGLRDDHEILITKAVLDGFTSFVLASTLGIGVILSAIPVFLFQGTITILANQIEHVLPEAIFNELLVEITAVGGLLIIAIGMNILKLTTIRVSNLLPALIVVVAIVYIVYLF